MEDIKKLVKDKKVFIGTQQTMKNLKTGKVAKVFLTSNCPEDVKDDIKHYAKISGTEVAELDIPNDELGVMCRKQFPISVLGIIKQ